VRHSRDGVMQGRLISYRGGSCAIGGVGTCTVPSETIYSSGDPLTLVSAVPGGAVDAQR
jgi:hypothetical protein